MQVMFMNKNSSEMFKNSKKIHEQVHEIYMWE